IPVKSLSATASVGTLVSRYRNISTVRPSAIDTGIPVSISASNKANTIPTLPQITPTATSATEMVISQIAAFCLDIGANGSSTATTASALIWRLLWQV